MEAVFLPTTKAQVSGHQFLMRRVEHGLVLGDIRMISDPLGARRRATLFGLLATGVLALGAGAMAFFRPEIDPGSAPIVRTESGALYVRIGSAEESALHPVLNLASARLIVGAPEKPAKASDSAVSGVRRGVPLGVRDAPGIIAPHPVAASEQVVCHAREANTEDVTVMLGAAPANPLGEESGLLAEVDGKQWLISMNTRALLPPEDDPLGRSIRRRVGINADTPLWKPAPEVLATIREVPPYQLPKGQFEVLETTEEFWLKTADRVHPLTETQAKTLRDQGTKSRKAEQREISNIADATGAHVELPKQELKWPSFKTVCVSGNAGEVSIDQNYIASGHQLAGKSVASRFSGSAAGGIGLDTGHGWVLLSEYGTVHRIQSLADASALGIVSPQPASWSVLRLLPEGSVLSQQVALQPSH